MKTIFLSFIILLLFSCNTYNFANFYSSHVLRQNNMAYHTIDHDKYSLTYWKSSNNKPPLILLHGFGTSGKFQWFEQSKELSKHYHLIIVNLLHFGSKPKFQAYSIEEQVAAVELLAEKLRLNSFYLCGTSYGGVIAAELALRNPSKVKKLVLMDVPLKYLTAEDVQALCRKYNISNEEELYVPGDSKQFKKLMSISYYDPPDMPMFMIRSFYKHSYLENKDDLKKVYKHFMEESEAFNFRNYSFKMPVLLIWGKEDQMVPVHVGQQLQEHIGANSRLVVVQQAGHIPNLEKEKVVNQFMVPFLNE